MNRLTKEIAVDLHSDANVQRRAMKDFTVDAPTDLMGMLDAATDPKLPREARQKMAHEFIQELDKADDAEKVRRR